MEYIKYQKGNQNFREQLLAASLKPEKRKLFDPRVADFREQLLAASLKLEIREGRLHVRVDFREQLLAASLKLAISPIAPTAFHISASNCSRPH